MPLLARILAYLRWSGMAPTRFGREVVNDPRFVRDLRNGREPREAMCRRVEAWLEEKRGVEEKHGLEAQGAAR